tara:strand:+ start:287 stop:496 length:210 start_codon:yes stop_codon:yes gene_type:complete
MIKYKKLIYHLYFYVLVIVFTPNLILGDICAQSLSSTPISNNSGQVIKMHRGGSISSHVKLPVIIGELK